MGIEITKTASSEKAATVNERKFSKLKLSDLKPRVVSSREIENERIKAYSYAL